MNDDERPNPEELLAIVQREESQHLKGKLKIFLGMAAGVGKTFAMLEAAQNLKKDGIDVVLGIVDTHGRQETAQLLDGLPIIPEKEVKYKGATFKELDLDAIIARKPEIVIVDELAHSNVTGSRHPKRWQDVMEILDHGIDVYTTLNVQHIESRADLVENIAGIKIRETVPDLIVDRATSIELIDLTPEELLRRLKEGKVYLGDQSAIAVRNFFKEDRLTALREIVLRYAAEKVDHDLHGMFSTLERAEAWKPRERLMVAVSHHSHSQKLIRITRRLAFNLNAPWIALHVDDGTVLDELEQKTLSINLALARDLGAEVITTNGDLAESLQRIARHKSVTQIIIGRSPDPWAWLPSFFQSNSLLDQLAKECSDIDLHVIRKPLYSRKAGKWNWRPFTTESLSSYFIALFFVLGLSLFNIFFLPYIGYKIAGFIFLSGILFLSLFLRKGPIFFASILYALIWFIFFAPPFELMSSSADEDLILLVFYFLTAIITGILTDRAKKNKEMLVKREKSLEGLYEIVQEIATSPSLEHFLAKTKGKLSSILDGKCEIILKRADNGLIFDETSPIFHNEKEQAAANWVLQNGKEAGWSTSTLPFAQNLYIPLKGTNEVVGVLAYRSKVDKEPSIEESNFLYTICQQLANYLEKSLAAEKERKLEHHRQVEKIYQSILNLISNLFEGPVLTIQDAIKEVGYNELPNNKIAPLKRIEMSIESLSRILMNISAMVNLSAGLTPIQRRKNDIKALIRSCYERIKKIRPGFTWSFQINENIPEILFDYDLIELLFFNLAFHAMEFALPESTIEVEAKMNGSYVIVSISSEGQSIPPEILEAAFEKIYRFPSSTNTGLGLGLAIGKTISEVHQGKLIIQNHPKGGMIFSLYLPIE